MLDHTDLQLLIRSRYPMIFVDSAEEQRVERLLGRIAERLDVPLFVWTLADGLRRQDSDKPIYDTAAPAKALGNLAAFHNEGIYYLKDLASSLEDPGTIRQLLDLVEPFARDSRAIIVSGAGLRPPVSLRPFAALYKLGLPDRTALERQARKKIGRLHREASVVVKLKPEELRRLVDSLSGLTEFEVDRSIDRIAANDGRIDAADIDRVAALRRERIAADGVLELVDVDPEEPGPGGLAQLRSWLDKRAQAMSPEAREFGLEPPRGMLLLGVQGCGKTMAARMVARQWAMPLLRLDAGAVYDKYIGESERRLEQALQTAERMAPCVLLIDEIEKALASGRDASADAGLSQRLLARLLGWLQDRKQAVFVVATSNAVTSLPPELMRKGRFDEIFFVDLPRAAERREIFATHLARRDRDPESFDLDDLAAAAAGFSGAEIEQAIVSALYSAFGEGTGLLGRHVLAELRSTRPLSVTRAEEIDDLRRWAEGRAVPAGETASAA